MAEVDPYTEQIVAKVAGVRAELRTHRDRIKVRAKAGLDEHRDGAKRKAKITSSSGTVDYFVNLDDPDGGAAGIEFGWTRKDGKPVEGLHVLRRAMGG